MRSRIGSAANSALIYLGTRRYLTDTQTGLRGIPAAHLERMAAIPGDRHEYELSALLTAAREGVEIDTVLFLLFAAIIGHAWIAVAIARVISGCVNFCMNRWFVFSADADRRSWRRAFAGYVALAGLVLALAMAGVQALMSIGVPLLAAKVGVDLALWCGSYAVQRSRSSG